MQTELRFGGTTSRPVGENKWYHHKGSGYESVLVSRSFACLKIFVTAIPVRANQHKRGLFRHDPRWRALLLCLFIMFFALAVFWLRLLVSSTMTTNIVQALSSRTLFRIDGKVFWSQTWTKEPQMLYNLFTSRNIRVTQSLFVCGFCLQWKSTRFKCLLIVVLPSA